MSARMFYVALFSLIGLNLAMVSGRMGGITDFFTRDEAARKAAYFERVLELVNETYVEEGAGGYDALTEAALEGMLRSLDPHSEYLSAQEFKALQQEIKSEFGGIGIQIELREGKVVVIAPIADTPGERAGILRGDQILAVDGKVLGETSLDRVVERLRGPPRSTVTLTLFRPATSETLEREIVREVIKVNSIRQAEMLDEGIGYLAITQFTERTGRDFRAALKELDEQGMRGLVLDLRNNPGGLLTAAVDVVEQFFPRGELVVFTQGRTERSRENIYSRGPARSRLHPVVVLINSGSASASEIVAGALKDTGRGVIIGETSFGKGSVQSILQLNNGDALRLTTAKYYTPSAVSIHERGVAPHISLPIPVEEEAKLRLQRIRSDLTQPNDFEQRFGFAPVPDRQLEAALDVLKGIFVHSRAAVDLRVAVE